MLKRITARGWKVGDFTLDLEDVNVLVGSNGSGKTSVMDAIRLALYHEVPGLGKQNQALMRGARGSRVSVSVGLEDSIRTVTLTRKGETVSKNSSEDPLKPEVPLSVGELQAMTAEQLRNLLSLDGGQYTAEDYLKDVEAEVIPEARSAMARCAVTGAGGLNEVSEWTREITDQASRESKNLKETRNALASTQRELESMTPVPKAKSLEWQQEAANLQAALARVNSLLSECSENAERARNTERNLNDAKRRLVEEQSRLDELIKRVGELSAMPEDYSEEEAEAAKCRETAQKLREEDAKRVRSLASVNNASKLLDAMIQRIDQLLGEDALDQGQKEKLSQARSIIDEIFFSMEGNIIEGGEKTRVADIEQLEQRATMLLGKKEAYQSALRSIGVSSLEHGKEKINSQRLQCSAIANEIRELEKELAKYEGSGKESLEQERDTIKTKLAEVNQRLSDVAMYENLVKTEANLNEIIGDLELKAEDMKLVAKAAVKVQAEYLKAPLRTLSHDLDTFCITTGCPRIIPSFEKIGKSMTLVIRVESKEGLVSLESISGGERLLVGCAFLYAINLARKPYPAMIFVESAELDAANAERLYEGLKLAATKGIQSIMTSFTEVAGAGVMVGQEAVATA